jgi:nitroreductase
MVLQFQPSPRSFLCERIASSATRPSGLAMQTIMLASKSLGYDSCPMIGFDIEGVAKLINLPKDYVIRAMVAVGKGTKRPWPKPGQLPLEEVVVENRFP